jgi:2-C-methyl-D-erythritol 4-phosphate cytidylyltransferase/2-C-methyl-D-erythritol 2,4-cyclodiphosphate synthase
MSHKHSISVIIPAAGTSNRFGGSLPKQYSILDDETVLEKVVDLFLGNPTVKQIIIPVAKNDQWIKSQSFLGDSRVAYLYGGNTRSESVFKALSLVEDGIDMVAIHDAARPWLTKDHFEELVNELIKDNLTQGVYPIISISDSMRKKSDEKFLPVSREDYVKVQTPQIFRTSPLKKALEKLINDNLSLSDETQAMEKAGFAVKAIQGERSNLKITFADDLENYLLKDGRIGRGIDFHQFQDGDGLILGNIFIDCNLSIVAHSDGDIVLHAVSDALLGAGGFKDIGHYFPDSDESNKNLSSVKILEKSIALLDERRLRPANIDFVIVCEQPKIGPYVDNIKKSLSELLNISENSIGVKATTTEGMGIIGKGNGIAVYAIASLRNL